MPLRFIKHELVPDVIFIEPMVRRDRRGWFMETYKRSDYDAAGIDVNFVQENESHSTSRYVLRGLHFQVEPRAHAKLVSCLEGRIFDVAVDLRQGSPTYGLHATRVLSGEDPCLVWIPVGFAHGFLTLSERATVLYKQTEEYSPVHERAIRWDDPQLAIEWPLKGERPLLSERDARAPLLVDAEVPFACQRGP